jgi:transposase
LNVWLIAALCGLVEWIAFAETRYFSLVCLNFVAGWAGSQLASASPAEVALAESTLKRISVPQTRGRPRNRPLRVVADRGYDSDPLRWRLLQRGILLIAPHRKNRKKPSLNDGRTLRRYRKRWKIERTFAWLGNFRRLLVRHDHHLHIYEAFFHLACLIITLRYL